MSIGTADLVFATEISTPSQVEQSEKIWEFGLDYGLCNELVVSCLLILVCMLFIVCNSNIHIV
jgi:hypothetical protein